MLAINVSSNIPQLAAQLQNFRSDQLPFATVLALTKTAQAVQKELSDRMPRDFDRPTPYTVRSVYTRRATKASPTAEVGLINEAAKGTPPSKYLRAQIFGGGRNMKRFERVLERAGYLGREEFLMPGKAAPIDSFGNVPQGFIVQMLSALRAFNMSGFNMNRKPASRGGAATGGRQFFFSRGDRGLPRGVWERFGPSGSGDELQAGYVRPIFIAVDKADFRKRFDFFGIAKSKALEVFPAQFNAAAQYAMQTARNV